MSPHQTLVTRKVYNSKPFRLQYNTDTEYFIRRKELERWIGRGDIEEKNNFSSLELPISLLS